MGTGRVVWGLLVVCLLCVATGGVAATEHASQYQLQADQPDPDTTVTRINLTPNGDAVWTIRFRTRLATAAEVDDYEAFQADFTANRSRYLDPFESRMTGVVAGANQSFDREMRAVDFAAETSIQEVPRRWGIVTFRFRWEGFAAETEGRLVVGDVFTGGFYITSGDTLEISLPDSYTLGDASPPPDETVDGVLRWSGPEDFTDGHPRVVAQRSPLGGFPGGRLGAIGAASIVAAILVGLFVRRKRNPGDGGSGSQEHDRSEPPEPTSAASTPDSSVEGDTVDTTEPTEEEVDTTIRTNEEQVVDLLARNDGQMKQAEIGAALEWSESKTSRVLSEMGDEGRIEKLRIGRENVIRLNTETDGS
ncbi:MAG: helix-turn-helix transcriptional regulator [Halonotius sp.]